MKIKRTLAFLLSIALMISLLPAIAFADESDPVHEETGVEETTEPENKEEEKDAEEPADKESDEDEDDSEADKVYEFEGTKRAGESTKSSANSAIVIGCFLLVFVCIFTETFVSVAT